MAQITLTPAEFIAWGNSCPSCLGEVDIILLKAHIVHISCPNCTWEQLACAIYGIKPYEFPLPSECASPTNPH